MSNDILLPPPPFIEGFEFRKFLGRGASGDVYLARDLQSDADIALKVVRKGPDSEQFDLERQGTLLQQELARISPHPPKVYRFGRLGREGNEIFWVAMEYIDGDDLAAALASGPLSEERSLHIALQLLEMLVLTHNFAKEIDGMKVLGVIHGDLKPQNIRLQRGDRVRVLDFGIARQLSLSNSYTHNPFGTLHYSPPERLEGGEVNEQSDLWAVAVILSLLLSGRLPFTGNTAEELRLQILRGDRSPLPSGCSRSLRYVVSKALNSDPKMRYPTAHAMKADLENILNGMPVLEPPSRVKTEPDAPGGMGDRHLTHRTLAQETWMQRALAGIRKRLSQAPGRRRSLLIVVGILLLSQGWVWWEAGSICDDLRGPSHQVDDLWSRYRRMDRICLLDLLLRDAPQEMKQALRMNADRILTTYVQDVPTTTAKDWEQARSYLTAAVKIDEDDVENRARLLYSEAQLSLIEGIRAKKARSDFWDKAVAGYQQALELDDWPDPHIALASFYDYKRFDFARLELHVRSAWKLGHPRDKRTRAMLADGHLTQSRNLLHEPRDRRIYDSEKVRLEDALQHALTAIALYKDGLIGFLGARVNHKEAVRLRDEARRRLARFN